MITPRTHRLLLSGDYPDPSMLRVGRDFYLTHSSFNYSPGLLIWRSRDLMNWKPMGYALRQYDGDVWAPDLVRHEGRYYIYYRTTGGNHVVWARDPRGPWSFPVTLDVEGFDPGHVVGPDGRRYLHMSGGMMVPLAANGLAVVGKARKVIEPWPIPDWWRVEGVCLEGPKLVRRGPWYYYVAAQGGTAGPATSHMVVVARSETPWGPWEFAPDSPLIRTANRSERWWSKGHGTLFDDAEGNWWCVCHGYEKGYRTLGRQSLISPVQWSAKGWPYVPRVFEEEGPLQQLPADDAFLSTTLNHQWRVWGGDPRLAVGKGALTVYTRGAPLAEGIIVATITGDHAYVVEVEVEREPGVEAGLFLFYSTECLTGLSFDRQGIRFCRRRQPCLVQPDRDWRRMQFRIVNDHQEVDFFFRAPGQLWQKLPFSVDASAYHHNAFGGFLSLRPALLACGSGRARFRSFGYRKIEEPREKAHGERR